MEQVTQTIVLIMHGEVAVTDRYHRVEFNLYNGITKYISTACGPVAHLHFVTCKMLQQYSSWQ